jgi:hypothetical protein
MPFTPLRFLSVSSTHWTLHGLTLSFVKLQIHLNRSCFCGLVCNQLLIMILYMHIYFQLPKTMYSHFLWMDVLRTVMCPVFTYSQYREAMREVCRLNTLQIGLFNVLVPNLFRCLCPSSGEETWKVKESGSSSVEKNKLSRDCIIKSYFFRDWWVSGVFPSSSVRKEHNVSECGLTSVLRWKSDSDFGSS